MSRSLHIAIDARWIFPEISGIGLYTQELIAALARCSSPHRFTVIFDNSDVMDRTATQTGFTQNKSFTSRLVNRGPFSPTDQIAMPKDLKTWGVDIFHATNYMMPLWINDSIKRVVTIHDLIPLLFRDHAPRSKKNRLFPVYKWLMNTVAARADMIISVSESTRQDIVNNMQLPENDHAKIRVIHEGVRAAYMPVPRTPHDDVVFLYVGRRDPYKNLPMLVEAFAEIRRSGLPARLRVVGGDDPRYPEAKDRAAALGIDSAIEWSGYIPDDELISAYQQADAFVLPSRYEGFGLPVLEAMACGTPVICSNTSSLPEVAGDAAILIDPSNLESLTTAMKRLVTESELRSQLSAKGLLQAKKFSWDTTARKTLTAYETVV